MRQVWASMVTVVTVIGTQISRMIFIMEAQKLNSELHGEVQRCIHRTSGKLTHFVLIYYIPNVLRAQLHPGITESSLCLDAQTFGIDHFLKTLLRPLTFIYKLKENMTQSSLKGLWKA